MYIYIYIHAYIICIYYTSIDRCMHHFWEMDIPAVQERATASDLAMAAEQIPKGYAAPGETSQVG